MALEQSGGLTVQTELNSSGNTSVAHKLSVAICGAEAGRNTIEDLLRTQRMLKTIFSYPFHCNTHSNSGESDPPARPLEESIHSNAYIREVSQASSLINAVVPRSNVPHEDVGGVAIHRQVKWVEDPVGQPCNFFLSPSAC